MKKQLYYDLNDISNYRNKFAVELFDQLEFQLNMDQIKLLNEYIHDYENPNWKQANFKGHDYLVSNIGEIKLMNGQILKIYGHSQKKYPIVWLNGNQLSIHRAVAEAFVPNPENKPEVNHINGNKHCNWYKNLEWVTRQENATHAKESGLMLKGSINPASKHTEEEAHKVCKLIEKGMKATAISKALNISKTFVIGILYRGEWSHVSSQYNIPKPKHFLDIDTVHEICRHLEKGKRDFEVAKELGLSWYDVNTIHQGKAWRRISNQYNIPGLQKTTNTELKLSEKIEKALLSGITNSEEVLKAVGAEKTKSHMKYVARIKQRLGLIK